MREHKIVVVTPAGRKHYLEVLKSYIFADSSIDEWHLWDNCRNPSDREYLTQLEDENPKVKIVRIPNPDGTNRSVNRFYKFCDDPGSFYIKMDDDIVFLPSGFGGALYERALREYPRYLWWSPLVINNAICSWLLKYHSKIDISDWVSCQAADSNGWQSPDFAMKLHRRFLSALRDGTQGEFSTPDFEVSLSRFSINCLGYFGKDVHSIGPKFCPPDVDDEEWLSACLPSMIGRPGRVIGSLAIAHFSFYTQERELLLNGILDKYYEIIGRNPEPYTVKKLSLRERLGKAQVFWGRGTRKVVRTFRRAFHKPRIK